VAPAAKTMIRILADVAQRYIEVEPLTAAA
jgi:hypothetical protein